MNTDFKRILIAIDNSTYADKAASVGFSLAQKTGAKVGLIFVVDVSKEIVSADLGITLMQIRTILLGEATDTLKGYLEKYKGSDSVEQFMPEGIPEKEIIKTSIDWNADVIVMGTHGRTQLGKILTGSVAEYVIRHSAIPVLIAPPRME